jgi:predicted phosphodiesterase
MPNAERPSNPSRLSALRRTIAPRRITALIVTILCSVSCYSWIGRYTTPTTAQHPYVDSCGRRYWYLDIAARSDPNQTQYTREFYVRDLFKTADPAKPTVALKKDLHPLQRSGQLRDVVLGDANDGDLVFRVGFISDVHIREPSVKLFNKNISEHLDYVIDSFERNGYQEAFQSSVFAATISAFNQLESVDEKPRLVIDTGDATDAGTIEEAYDFASVMHYLRYPMLYALGNHDDAIFGNYKHNLGYTKDAGPTFYPAGQRVRFMKFFNKTRTIAGFTDALVPLPGDFPGIDLSARWGALDVLRENDPGVESPSPGLHKNTCGPAGVCKQVTGCAGFDLFGSTPGASEEDKCDTYPGYYSVILPGDHGSKVQLIALNTTRGDDDWGDGAAFGGKQPDWLVEQLKAAADVTIVFMHHRPADVPGLLPILNATASTRPLVVLSGHAHSHATEWRGHFWELNTGSLEEFPQWARLVEIRRAAGGRYYLNARVLRPHLPLRDSVPDLRGDGVPQGLPLDDWDTLGGEKKKLEAWFETQFAICDGIANLKQPDYGGMSKTLLRDSAQCGYLGALYDHVFVPYAVLQKASSQRAGDARQQANVIVDISKSP